MIERPILLSYKVDLVGHLNSQTNCYNTDGTMCFKMSARVPACSKNLPCTNDQPINCFCEGTPQKCSKKFTNSYGGNINCVPSNNALN